MSTKIYDAFRVLKEKDIKGLITEMRSIASDTVANSADYLYLIHAIASADAAEKKDADKAAMAAYEDVIKNHFGISIEMWMLNMVKKAETSIEKDILDCSLKAVCTFDDEFWYIKFFSNSGISRKMLNNILEKLELEDFHYQNQSDPPEEISQEEFIDDEFDDDIEIGFQEDFSRILITGKSHDNIAVQSPLESGVIFAPRLKDRESKGKIYSSNKYDKKYTEHKYNEETPGVYSEKKGSKENSKEDNK